MPTFYAESVHIFSLQPVLQFESMEGGTGRPVQQAPLLVKPARLYELYAVTIRVDNPKMDFYFSFISNILIKVLMTSKFKLTSHFLVQVTSKSSCKTYTGHSRFRPQAGHAHWTERAHHQGVSEGGVIGGTTSYHSKPEYKSYHCLKSVQSVLSQHK